MKLNRKKKLHLGGKKYSYFKINLIVSKGICQVLKKLNEVKPRRILSARIPKIREEFICSSYSNNLKF
jgi:hypothetical protein